MKMNYNEDQSSHLQLSKSEMLKKKSPFLSYNQEVVLSIHWTSVSSYKGCFYFLRSKIGRLTTLKDALKD
jgi:hypothetical protein